MLPNMFLAYDFHSHVRYWECVLRKLIVDRCSWCIWRVLNTFVLDYVLYGSINNNMTLLKQANKGPHVNSLEQF
jgi:hypothetical protein